MATLNDAILDHLLLGIEGQENLFAFVGPDGGWSVDLAAGILELETPGGGVQLPIWLLGTRAAGDNSWMWAWANPSQQGKACSQQVAGLRARAADLGIPELDTPLFGLDGIHDAGQAEGSGVALVAAQLLGASATFFGDTGAGEAYFALPSVLRQPADPVRFPRWAQMAAEIAATSSNPVRMLHMMRLYGAVHGLSESVQPGSLDLRWPGGSTYHAAFDPQGRLVQLSGQLSGGDAFPPLPYLDQAVGGVQ